jgi:hypothetical protein
MGDRGEERTGKNKKKKLGGRERNRPFKDMCTLVVGFHHRRLYK